MSSASFQLPFSFAFAGESQFGSFSSETANGPLLHHLQRLQQSPGRLSWLWGREGSGKTHLLQALCQQHPEAIYLPMQKLLGYEPDCLAGLQDSSFLVIDDVNLVCGKRDWEEQLFTVCNQLLVNEGF
ncbi:MAG: DnaA regulatory inactivator Hda, partial [Pseudomonadota bacterium]